MVLQEPGSNLVLRQSGHIKSGERVHIYSADMRRTVSLQFYPDGYELVEPQPVLISQGYSSSQAGVQGRQKLPEVFRVQRSGGEPQEIFLDREIDMEAWQMNDKVSGGVVCLRMPCTSCSEQQGCPTDFYDVQWYTACPTDCVVKGCLL